MPTKQTHTPMEHLLCLRFLSQCQVLHNNLLSHLCVESSNCCCLLIAFVLFFGYLLPHNNNNICRLRQSCVLSSLLLFSLLLLRHFSHSHRHTVTLTLTHANLRFAWLWPLARETQKRERTCNFAIIITIAFKHLFSLHL